MKRELEDKVIVITGAGGGVGKAAVKIMAAQGAKIVALDIDEKLTEKVVKGVINSGGEAISVACDISDEQSVFLACKTVIDTYGKVDVLFNNAGIVGHAKAILEMDKAGLQQVLNVNVLGSYIMSIEFAKVMKKQGHGRIINTASIAGIQAEYGASAYCISKAAVEMMTQCIELELGEFGISAVSICPGPIKTKMLMDAYSDRAEVEGIPLDDYFTKMTSTIPGRRYAEPEEIANIAAFLANEKSYHIAGTHIIASGGQILR